MLSLVLIQSPAHESNDLPCPGGAGSSFGRSGLEGVQQMRWCLSLRRCPHVAWHVLNTDFCITHLERSTISLPFFSASLGDRPSGESGAS